MRHISVSMLIGSLLSLAACEQSAAPNAALDSEKTAIMKVHAEYFTAMQAEQAERDRVRERLLTEDYFYMGVDGLPAGKHFVMQRQKRNGLRINSIKVTGLEIRLYGNTAILPMRLTAAGVDKGQAFGGDGKENGHTTVMVKQEGIWRIAADIVGREIGN